ncbi:molybdopterin-dependent oxidoreductase [Thermomonospora umbrina]|uniref:molybdopterin-dependent oxidoreductase n=1 Tax=Thermomonospora umbrina TaxID=111806 RepID=UPI001FEC015E|nr:molybdopterin-dependent oxidoreductase [Thermomonospora umbrina]
MNDTTPSRRRRSLPVRIADRWWAALAGVLAAAVGLGAAELAAALAGQAATAPILALGSAGIDVTPQGLKAWAIRTFGDNDKAVLLASLGAGATVVAALAGLLARRHRTAGVCAVAGLGVVAAAAAVGRPQTDGWAAVPSLVGALAGAAALILLLRAMSPRGAGPSPDANDAAPAGPDRRVLLAGAGTLAVAASTGGLGRVITARRNVSAARRGVRLPPPTGPGPAVPAGAQVRVPGMPPFTTPNGAFYRVDTALVLPQVDPADWTLRIGGMVDRPVELTFEELLRRPLIDREVTLTCVSNEVGGPYVGHARWLGVPLAVLLREAGVRAGADQLLSRSADGWTCGTPLSVVLDGRDALLAVGMNGVPLPIAHGFPARLVVPGLYGYVSATKWVVDLQVTRYADQAAYWTRRGWATDAPVKTMARIDLPRPLQRLRAGRVAVAGVAWAQHRGVDAVEVRVDGGPWHPARLATVPGIDTWRQWVWEWNATPGTHRLEARATDATGRTQISERVPPFPSGATGRPSVVVTVT